MAEGGPEASVERSSGATLDVIERRRSIRAGFENTPIDEGVVERILGAGLRAPSSKNAQPWRLHVVVSEELRQQIASAVESAKDAANYVPIDPTTGGARPGMKSSVIESASVMRTAPLAILIENVGSFSGGRANVSRAPARVLENSLVGYGLEIVGIGACIQTMWLAAEALGLRGVFMGDIGVAEAEIKGILGIEGDLFGALCLGRANVDAPGPRRLEKRSRRSTRLR